MEEGNPILGFVWFVVFLILNAVLYGFSAAIQSISEKDLEKQAEEGRQSAKRILKIKEKPEKLINTIQVSSIGMAMAVGFFQMPLYSRQLMQHYFQGRLTIYFTNDFVNALAYLLVGIYLVFLILAISVLVPKKLGVHFHDFFAYAFVNIAMFFMVILTPMTALISFLTNLILNVFGINPKEDAVKVTEEEIMLMVNEGHESGSIMASEAEMITNIFELGDKEAQDVMIHRKHIVALDGEKTLEEVVLGILQENKSRFPVYLEDMDNIIGILHFKDAMTYYQRQEYRNWKVKDIPDLIRKATFIPETKNLDAVFREMQSEKKHMEIVVDEYGQTAGLIAMEDILEEIVGNILDEYDEEENHILPLEDGTYQIKGLTPLEELEDELGIQFEDNEFDTLNGYLTAKLNRILEEDDRPTIEVFPYQFQVVNVEDKMIESVILRKMEIEETPEENQEKKEVQETA